MMNYPTVYRIHDLRYVHIRSYYLTDLIYFVPIYTGSYRLICYVDR